MQKHSLSMKVAPKLIILLKDLEGFGSAIYDALQPNPNSSLRKLEQKFELSLEKYGIKDQKASGCLSNFVNNDGTLQVSLLLVDHYEIPTLSCVVNEVLGSIRENSLPSDATVILPFILPASKLKCGDNNSVFKNKASSLYCLQVGPVTDCAKNIVGAADKLPSSVQIHYEPLACLLQFVRCLNFPTAVLIGRRGTRGDYELLHEIGEHLATTFTLLFEKNCTKLSIGEKVKAEEPWRALYG